MDPAHIIDDVCQIFLGKNLSNRVTPPLRHLLARVPEQVAIDDGNGVQKIGSAALANEFRPLGGIFAFSRQRNPDVLNDVRGEPLGVISEDSFPKQRGYAV